MITATEATPALAFDVEVVRAVRLSPTFVRLTFGGPALASSTRADRAARGTCGSR